MCHCWLVQAESHIITVIPITAYLKSRSLWLRLLFPYWFNLMTVTKVSNNKNRKIVSNKRNRWWLLATHYL